MSDDIDTDLAKLLASIDDAEKSGAEKSGAEKSAEKNDVENDDVEVVTTSNKKENVKEVKEMELSDNKISDFNSLGDEEDEDEEDEDEGLANVEVVSEIDKDKSDIERNVIGLFKQHCSSAQAMLDEADQDRKRIDDVIALILPKIESNDYRGTDIQALASLLQTKTEVSKNRSSHMDSIAKLFAALKNNDSVGLGGKANTGDDDITKEELDKLLNKKNR